MIFLVPLFGINLCLITAQNPQLLENTIFEVIKLVYPVFHSYLDGSLSIIERTYPQFLVFKPAMWLTLLYFIGQKIIKY